MNFAAMLRFQCMKQPTMHAARSLDTQHNGICSWLSIFPFPYQCPSIGHIVNVQAVDIPASSLPRSRERPGLGLTARAHHQYVEERSECGPIGGRYLLTRGLIKGGSPQRLGA